MKIIFPLFLLLMTTASIATHSQPVKVFMNGQTVKIGINLSCPSNGLSSIASPNIIISQDNTHFDIIMSHRAHGGILCTPLPHEFIDEGRDYFDLGDLPSGQYTITANYVIDDASLPPQPGVEVYEFDQTGFFVAQSVPISNKYSLFLLMLLLGLLSYKFRRKL